jgi:hypothetical protein
MMITIELIGDAASTSFLPGLTSLEARYSSMAPFER